MRLEASSLSTSYARNY